MPSDERGVQMYKMPVDLAGLLRSEWETIIEEAGFDEVDEGMDKHAVFRDAKAALYK